MKDDELLLLVDLESKHILDGKQITFQSSKNMIYIPASIYLIAHLRPDFKRLKLFYIT